MVIIMLCVVHLSDRDRESEKMHPYTGVNPRKARLKPPRTLEERPEDGS